MSSFLEPIPTPEILKSAVEASLKSINSVGPLPIDAIKLLILDQSTGINTPVDRLNSRKQLTNFIRKLGHYDAKQSHLLHEHFLNGISIKKYADTYGPSSRFTVNDHKNKALIALTDLILNIEREGRKQRRLAQKRTLLTPKNPGIFGVNALIANTVTQLCAPTAAPAICLTGIGGSGKTAVADAIVRRVIDTDTFRDVFWFRADPNQVDLLGALAAQVAQRFLKPGQIRSKAEKLDYVINTLSTQPYLVIIDNLEGDNNFAEIADFIQQISGASKVLLTSRAYPDPLAAINVVRVPLNEISFDAAVELLTTYATQHNNLEIIQTVREQAEDIYLYIGGHPFALKLVVGMLAKGLPIKIFLSDLSIWSLRQTQDLYDHIYKKLWTTLLSPSGKELLRSMPIVADKGGKLADIEVYSGLHPVLVYDALQELIEFALVEERGSLTQPAYGLHSLTTSFLLRDIIAWPSHSKVSKRSEEKLLFIKAIRRAVELWTKRTTAAKHAFLEQVQELDTIRNVAKFGLVEPDTHAIVVDLVSNSFEIVWRDAEEEVWLTLIQDAIAVCPTPETKAKLLQQYGYALRETRQFDAAVNAYTQSLAILEAYPDYKDRYRNHIGLALCYRAQKRSTLHKQQLALAAATLPQYEDTLKQAEVYDRAGWVYLQQGNVMQSVRAYKQALRLYESAGDTSQYAMVLMNLGATYYTAGHDNLAYIYYAKASAYADQSKVSNFVYLYTEYSIGCCYFIAQRYEDCIAHLTYVLDEHNDLFQHSTRQLYEDDIAEAKRRLAAD